MLLLSTRKPISGTTMDDKIKVTLCKFYGFTKGDIDKVGQRMSFYTCKFKPHKWSMVAFSYIVDMTRMNSSTPFALNENRNLLKQNSFEFGTDVICCLVDPFIQQRNQSHLAPSIKQKIAVVLDKMQLPSPAAAPPKRADSGNFSAKSEKRSRCYMVIEQLPANQNQKSISGTKSLCQAWGKYTHPKHLVRKCKHCA